MKVNLNLRLKTPKDHAVLFSELKNKTSYVNKHSPLLG